jgi:hypothetical protein
LLAVGRLMLRAGRDGNVSSSELLFGNLVESGPGEILLRSD